jgi:hypothetical protein
MKLATKSVMKATKAGKPSAVMKAQTINKKPASKTSTPKQSKKKTPVSKKPAGAKQSRKDFYKEGGLAVEKRGGPSGPESAVPVTVARIMNDKLMAMLVGRLSKGPEFQPPLKDLYLTQISDRSMEALAELIGAGALAELEELGLGKIGDQGMMALAEGLKNKSLPAVTHMGFDYNAISDAGRRCLAKALDDGALPSLIICIADFPVDGNNEVIETDPLYEAMCNRNVEVHD